MCMAAVGDGERGTCEHRTCGDAVASRLLFMSLLQRLCRDSSTVAKVRESENFVDPERGIRSDKWVTL